MWGALLMCFTRCGGSGGPCGWRTNMGIGPATASPATQVFLCGPAYMTACNSSAWINDDIVSPSVGSVFLGERSCCHPPTFCLR